MAPSGDPRQLPRADAGAPSPRPPRGPRRGAAWRLVLLLVGAAALSLGALVLLLLSRPAKRVDQAVEQLLAEPVPRGVGSAEVVLGMASPFTGANRELGRAIKAGVEAAFAAANEAGGVEGRTLRLVAVDDGYEPSRTGPAMKQLVETERVLAVVGNVGTPTAAVSVPYCTQQKVVLLGALSGGDVLRKQPPDRYVFNYRPSYAEETAWAVRYLVEARRIAPGRIAVFAQEDEFGDSGWRGIEAELARRGLDPGRVVRVGYRRNTADVGAAVAALRARARDVDAVVMVATYRAAAAFIRKVRDAGLRFLTTNVSAVDSDALAEQLVTSGPRHFEGVVVTQVVPLPSSRSPGVVRFREAMARHAPDQRPGFLSLEGWIVGSVLVEALRRAGRDVDAERLVDALEGIRELDLGVGTRISFGPGDHQASHKVWGTLLQRDGTWRQIDLDSR